MRSLFLTVIGFRVLVLLYSCLNTCTFALSAENQKELHVAGFYLPGGWRRSFYPKHNIFPPQDIIGLLYMFLFHFNIDFFYSDSIRGAFRRPRFHNLFRRACMFPDTWSHSTHGPMITS